MPEETRAASAGKGPALDIRAILRENARLRAENAALRNRIAVMTGEPIGRERVEGRPLR